VVEVCQQRSGEAPRVLAVLTLSRDGSVHVDRAVLDAPSI
jgi:hypothetical protein